MERFLLTMPYVSIIILMTPVLCMVKVIDRSIGDHLGTFVVYVEGGLPRTPAMTKRNPNDNHDTGLGQSTNRLSAKRTTPNDSPDNGDNM